MQVGGESGWWMRLAAGAMSCVSLDFDGIELIYLCQGSGPMLLSELRTFFWLLDIYFCLYRIIYLFPPISLFPSFQMRSLILHRLYLIFLSQRKKKYLFLSHTTAACSALVPMWLSWNLSWVKFSSLFTGVFPSNLSNLSFSDQDWWCARRCFSLFFWYGSTEPILSIVWGVKAQKCFRRTFQTNSLAKYQRKELVYFLWVCWFGLF